MIVFSEGVKINDHVFIYAIKAITFSSMAIGVGRLFTSTVVLQAFTFLKYSP
jgi:hypothetical protein